MSRTSHPALSSQVTDRVTGAVLLVLAAALAWTARSFVAPIQYEPVGPRAFPLLLAAVIALGGLHLLLRPRADAVVWPRGAVLAGVACTVVALLGYALLFAPIGFMAATTLATLAIGRLFGGGWKPCLAGGVGLGLGCYLLFDKLLDVALPLGFGLR